MRQRLQSGTPFSSSLSSRRHLQHHRSAPGDRIAGRRWHPRRDQETEGLKSVSGARQLLRFPAVRRNRQSLEDQHGRAAIKSDSKSACINLRGGAGRTTFELDLTRFLEGARTLCLVTRKAVSATSRYDHWNSACRPDNRNSIVAITDKAFRIATPMRKALSVGRGSQSALFSAATAKIRTRCAKAAEKP